MDFFTLMFSLFADCYAGMPLRMFMGLAHQLPSADIHMNGRRLRVIRQIGEGGYAFVFLVRQVPTPDFPSKENSLYALKRIHTSSGDKLAEARREIEIMQALRHPNILPLVDSCISETQGADGCPVQTVNMLFPAFEDGHLAAEVERLHAARQRLSTRNVLHVFRQVCAAVAHMHEHGWAHRDIKPHNVMIVKPKASHAATTAAAERDDGLSQEDQAERGSLVAGDTCYRAVLIDFGSARPVRQEIQNRYQALALQEEAEASCTATYRAPELFDVPSRCTIDERVDVWSLGCTLYHIMYGASPFQKALDSGGTLQLAVMQGRVTWPKLAMDCYPEPLHQLVMWCLTPDPALRPFVSDLMRRVDELLSQNHGTAYAT